MIPNHLLHATFVTATVIALLLMASSPVSARRRGLVNRTRPAPAPKRQPVPSLAQPVELVVFGDSIADQGRRLVTSNYTVPDPNYYWKGRFSNGPNYVDYLNNTRTAYNRTIYQVVSNQAVGQATSCSNEYIAALDANILTVGEQVDAYLSQRPASAISTGNNRAVIMFIGMNDIGWALYLDPTPAGLLSQLTATVQCEAAAIGKLIQAGEKNILVAGAVDLSTFPDFSQLPAAAGLKLLATRFNGGVQQAIGNLQSMAPNGTKVVYFDLKGVTEAIRANASQYGFKDVDTSCLTVGPVSDSTQMPVIEGACDNPNDFYYFDNRHPTTNVHKAVAEHVKQKLYQEFGL